MKKLLPIPESRSEFRKNELPVCQADIAYFSDTFGEEMAETVRFYVQHIRMSGGINPKAVECIFPEGRDGPINHNELFRIVGNISVWSEYEAQR